MALRGETAASVQQASMERLTRLNLETQILEVKARATTAEGAATREKVRADAADRDNDILKKEVASARHKIADLERKARKHFHVK